MSCRFARMALYELLEKLHQELPWATVREYVDDLAQVTFHRDEDVVVQRTVQAGCFLVKGLEALGFTMSAKSLCMSSTKKLATSVVAALKRAGVTLSHTRVAKDLGMDSSLGRRRTNKVISTRFHKAAARGLRTRQLRSFGAPKAIKLYTTNLWPTGTYGIAGFGIASKPMQGLRTVAATAAGWSKGACVTTTIACSYPARHEPAVAARVTVLKDFAWALQTTLAERPRISAVWDKLVPKLDGAMRWARVRGPIGAAIAVLKDIGWDPIRPWAWSEGADPSDTAWLITLRTTTSGQSRARSASQFAVSCGRRQHFSGTVRALKTAVT